ncbi:DUF2637 domain-containing protein [Actinomadura oligospora]|uniref:DUF2637 domain-containing protein n=1 Tax=Actinomadura oligospora TaxID=111804 RepID=UPI00047E7EF5|nr:DUF2637 domain-containing protein [Actinomadura oligospora]
MKIRSSRLDDSACQVVRADRLIRGTTTAAVGLLALIAAVVSYRHMHRLALTHGESSLTAALIPLSVDGMIVAASMSILSAHRPGAVKAGLPGPS